MTAIRGALLGGAFLLATAASGFAEQTGPNGPYFGLKVACRIPATSAYGPRLAWRQCDDDRDEGFIGGAAAGYQFGPFRAELNGDYSRNGVNRLVLAA